MYLGHTGSFSGLYLQVHDPDESMTFMCFLGETAEYCRGASMNSANHRRVTFESLYALSSDSGFQWTGYRVKSDKAHACLVSSNTYLLVTWSRPVDVGSIILCTWYVLPHGSSVTVEEIRSTEWGSSISKPASFSEVT
jgi:hypothetical protein